MIFHRKLILHFEVHRGYRPRLSVRLEPKPGTKATDGGEPGRLVRCPTCSGDGLLHAQDEALRTADGQMPQPDERSEHLKALDKFSPRWSGYEQSWVERPWYGLSEDPWGR